MMNQDIRKIIQEEIAKSSNAGQFGTSNVPFHIHNGIDSNTVPAQYLDFTNFAIWGQAVLSTGLVTITNRNVLPTSVALAVSTSAITGTGGAYPITATYSNGTIVFSDSGKGSGATINYLIIF